MLYFGRLLCYITILVFFQEMKDASLLPENINRIMGSKDYLNKTTKWVNNNIASAIKCTLL